MRHISKLCAISGLGLMVMIGFAAPSMAELVGAAVAPLLDRERLQFAESINPKCQKCSRELDKCEKNPPYGNERICASNYYDCIRQARARCE